MSTTSLVTADELLALPTGMGKRYELVAGELRVMSPAGWPHGIVISKLHNRLGNFVEQNGLGITFGAETGFRLASNPDTVRAPDFAFIAKEHLPTMLPKAGFWPGAPDIAVEVLSPDDRTAEVNEKMETWLTAGCRAVWVIDPELETATIYHSGKKAQVFFAGQTLIGDPEIPGFSCLVSELFQ